MESLDNRIAEILKKDVSIPDKAKDRVRNFIIDKNCNHRFFLKTAICTCFGILFFASIAIAINNYVINKSTIWTEPIEYSTNESEVISKEKIFTEEELNEMITPEEAKKIAKEFLNKFEYEEDIYSVELKKGDKAYYAIKTREEKNKGFFIIINPKKKNIVYFEDLEFSKKIYQTDIDIISEKQAKEIANNVLDKFRVDSSYEFKEVTQLKTNNQNANIWFVTFSKKYDGNYSNFEKFTVSFVVSNNTTYYYMIRLNEGDFENNLVNISKEQAIKIAKDKEEEFTNIDIGEISAEISIKMMNPVIYLLENIDKYSNNSDTIVRMEDKIIRKVWTVNVKHINKKTRDNYEDINYYIKENANKIYYVDTTTGEIIGGEVESIE